MNAGAKLGAFGLVLAAALGGGAGLGAVAGPLDVGADDHEADHGAAMAEAAAEPVPQTAVAGLAVAEAGYRLVPERRLLGRGPFVFSILRSGGAPVREYDEVHERELHLIVASRDLQQFVHVHPIRDRSGRWSVDLPALPPGAYRAFADFRPTGGPALTLGVDLVAPGAVTEPRPLHESRADAVAGFDVVLDGDLRPGSEAEVAVTVRRSGSTVTTDPYLGSAGHLVALRDGDLAYLHVHPLDDVPGGPVRFAVEVPSAGTYALFFDFLVDGQLHTARFVVTATERAAPSPSPSPNPTTAPPAGHAGGHDR